MFKRITNEKINRFNKFLLSGLFILGIMFVFSKLFGNQVQTVLDAVGLVLTPILIALVITYLVQPLCNVMIYKFKFHKKLAAAVTTIITFAAFIGFMTLIVTFLSGIIQEVIDTNWIVEKVNMFKELLITTINQQKVTDFIEGLSGETALNMVQLAVGSIKSIASNVSIIIIDLVLIPIFTLFFLMGKEKIFSASANVLPKNIKTHVVEVGKRSNEVIRQYFRGKILSMVFIFLYFSITFCVLFLFIKMETMDTFMSALMYAAFFALGLTILDLIPYIGPTFGIIVPVIYTAISPVTNLPLEWWVVPLIILGINFLGQFLQNNVIQPLIIGKEMNINPLLIIVSMIFFGNILGIWGVLLSIPLCGCIAVTYKYMIEYNTKMDFEFDNKKKRKASKIKISEDDTEI